MSVVLVTVHKGFINNVKFYDEISLALMELAEYVKSMNKNENDAAVCDSDGIIANAKDLLEKGNQSIDEVVKEIIADKKKENIYIIADSVHSLGFLAIGKNEPIGYNDPVKALVALEKLRKTQGIHIKLYRVDAITGSIIKRKKLEEINSKKGKTEFEYSLIEEYLK